MSKSVISRSLLIEIQLRPPLLTKRAAPEAIVLNALKVLDAKLEMTKSELDIVKSEMDTAGVE